MQNSIIHIWKSHLDAHEFRKQTFATLALLVVFLFSYGKFILNIEQRPGVVLNDPLLALIPAKDVAWIVFALLYSCVVLMLYQAATRPFLVLLGFQTFMLMYVFRTAAIYLAPLDPPYGYIPMEDPAVNMLIPNSNILSRDLFFSGHTAVMTIGFLFSTTPNFRMYMGVCTILLMGFLAIQHVHYSIDIFIAPLVTYSSYKLVMKYQTANGLLKEMQEENIRSLGLVF